MTVRPIRTDADLRLALGEIEALWGAEPGTEAGDRLDVLAVLADDYEDRAYPAGPLDPVDLLHYAIDDMGRSRNDLATVLGSRQIAEDVLARRLPLTLEMIRAVSAAWRLPADLLIRSYPLAA